jgi:small-conductance mechanosensitive channel
MKVENSIKMFVTVLVLLIATTVSIVFLFDQLVAIPIKLSMLFTQTIKTIIVIIFGSIIILFIRRSKSLITRHIGIHPATIFQFFMVLIAAIVVFFAVLNIFQVSSTTLLVGGGIVSITMGLVISTFVGNILAGTLVLMTNPFRVGDTVLVNNIPGRIEEITTIFTRIRNDIGGNIVIPNTAIIQGSLIVTKIPNDEAVPQTRLPYSLGDRVYTTYMNEEGVVKELTPFHTKILLDSGKELTFLNNTVLTGSVAVAKISLNTADKKHE